MNEDQSVFSIAIWCVSGQLKERQLNDLSRSLMAESTGEILIKSTVVRQNTVKFQGDISSQKQINPSLLSIERSLRTGEGRRKQKNKEIINHHYHNLSVDILSGFDALHLPQYALSRLQKCDLLIIVISGGANREKEGTVSFISPGREADSSDDYLSRLVKKTSYYRRYQESLKNPEPTFEQQNPNAENIDKNITVREQLDLAQRISVNLKDPKPKVIFCFYGVDLDNQTMNIVNDSLELKKRRKRHQENKYVYVLNYPGWSPYVSDAWNKIDVFQVRKFAGLLLNELEKIEKWRLSSNFNKSNCLFKWFFGNDRLREYVPYNKT